MSGCGPKQYLDLS